MRRIAAACKAVKVVPTLTALSFCTDLWLRALGHEFVQIARAIIHAAVKHEKTLRPLNDLNHLNDRNHQNELNDPNALSLINNFHHRPFNLFPAFQLIARPHRPDSLLSEKLDAFRIQLPLKFESFFAD